jgi:hypothetical protein
MAKPNYQHARRQKEAARKARQQEKLQKKQAAKADAAGNTATGDNVVAADAAIVAGTNIT